MVTHCRLCRRNISNQSAPGNVTNGLCEACLLQVSSTADNSQFLESIDAPILLMQESPRQVITANRRAQELFDKDLLQIEQHRGGQVFDCIHSFSEAGCGKDTNCEHCTIKEAIVDTFNTANSHTGVSAQLSIKKTESTKTYTLEVSTEKIGGLALVRIDRFSTKA